MYYFSQLLQVCAYEGPADALNLAEKHIYIYNMYVYIYTHTHT